MKALATRIIGIAVGAAATSAAFAQPPGALAPLGPPPVPPANPITVPKTNLGKALFWDEQLSSTGTMACGTCHIPEAGGSDPRAALAVDSVHPGPDGTFGNGDDRFASPGVIRHNAAGTYEWESVFRLDRQVTPRRGMSVINAAYPPVLFWDGRATSEFRDPVTNAVVIPAGGALESQAAGPPVDGTEMGHMGRAWTDVAASLTAARPLALASGIPADLETWIDGRSYPELFEEAFGTPEITPTRILLAIGTYERTLVANQTPFDASFGPGGTPLTAAEQRGQQVFLNRQCAVCHGGPLLSDNQFHYTGVRPPDEDIGREGVTGNPQNRAEMRTPPLRNVELRAPYMRNGRFASLEEVVDFYNRGGDFNAPNKAPQIVPLNLSAGERADLLAFLRRPLTDPRVTAATGPFTRPTLYTESDRVPATTTPGVAGSGGIVPEALAIEPPLAGNANFTIGVRGGFGGAQATLVIADEEPPASGPVPSAVFSSVTVTLLGEGNGAGYGSVVLELPDRQADIGRTLHGRWYVADASAPDGIASSQAFRFTIFGVGEAAEIRLEGFVIY